MNQINNITMILIIPFELKRSLEYFSQESGRSLSEISLIVLEEYTDRESVRKYKDLIERINKA